MVSSGLISGAPTSAGVYSISISATNGDGTTYGTLVLTVSPATLTFTSAANGGLTAEGYTASGENLSLSLDYVPSPGDVLTVINNTGSTPIIGTFSNLADGGTIGLTYNGTTYDFTANYEGGNGNDLTLTYVPPSPPAARPPFSLTILHTFGDGTVTNDGANPGAASLILASDGNFYGTTGAGGTSNGGCVYQITSQGQMVVLHRFSTAAVVNINGNSATDGLNPASGLIQGADGNFYGTTKAGGAANEGTVLRITSQGLVTILHSFGDGSVTADGTVPLAGVVQGSDGNFYGTTSSGGTASKGTIFVITPLGQLTILHSFGDGSVALDGYSPGAAALIQGADGNFYSTCMNSSAGAGCAYKITPLGVMTILHSFSYGTSATNDGTAPDSGFVQGPDGNFYGTTYSFTGSLNQQGCVYKMTPQGQVTILHGFKDGTVTNDGTQPYAGLYLSADGNYYGTTTYGGSTASSTPQTGSGTIYQITPQGVVTLLHNFGDGSVTNDGTLPMAGLIQGSDGSLYGVTSAGGTTGQGTVFKLNLNLPSITSALSANGTIGIPFNYQTTGTNMPSSYAATNLPAGLSIGATTGLISGTPTALGTTTSTVTLTNAQGSSSFPISITIGSLPAPTISSVLTSFGSVGMAYNYTITAYSNVTSYSTSVLPAGLNLNSATGAIYGTPTSVGTYFVSIYATNATGTTSATLSIQVTGNPPTLGQEYVVIHRFADGSVVNDGKEPTSIFEGFDGTLYGTTTLGGSDTNGAIFNMTVQGTTSILNSTGGGGQGQYLIQGSDGSFYGTTLAGGINGNGTVFKMTPLGVRTILHYFGDGTVASDGISPNSGLIQAFDGSLYGTTSAGGSSGKGTVFRITTLGVVTIMHNFGDGTVTNDGTVPGAGLFQAPDSTFYGTTQTGGSAGKGAIFKMSTAGALNILHNFGDGSVPNDGIPVGFNGAPTVVQGFDGNFYGVTSAGGSSNEGAVYMMTPSGAVTILHSFGDGTVASDGIGPVASLVAGYDGNFYGTTFTGGSENLGTVFEITPTGTVVIIHSFGDGTITNDGANPEGQLYQDGNGNFYGTATTGGVSGSGVAFTIVASQGTTHVPVFIGSSTIISPELSAVTFIPKVAYGVSGSDSGIGGMFVKAGGASGSGNGKIGKSFTSETSWALTGTLPLNLVFDPSSGTITGTPVQAGIFTVVMTPSNIEGTGTPTTITLYIDVAPILSGPNSVEAFVGSPFSYQIAALANPTRFGATGMPAWMTVDTVLGVISGTPPGAGTFNFNPTASNVSGTATQQVSLTVGNPAPSSPTITSSASATATAGTAFTYQITATNNPTSYAAVSLPPGLLFSSSTGTITGTPTSVGTFKTSISASNANGTYTSALQITVAAITVPQITSSSSITGISNTALNYQIAATGLPTSYSSTTLPTGLTLNLNTGAITGTPTTIGSSTITLSAINGVGTGTATLTITVQPPVPAITSSLNATVTVGTSFSYQIAASNSPTTFAAAPLPTGLALNGSGDITGKPTVPGTYNVTLSATNSYGTSSSTLSLTVSPTLQAPVISSATAATGTTYTPFSYQITASNSPASYSATGLPSGLTISGTSGVISGTPTTAGSSSVTISATNATGTTSTKLTVTIQQESLPVITSATSAQGVDGNSFAYQITASPNPTSYNALGLPGGLLINSSTGAIFGTPAQTGTFTVTISATNGAGTVSGTLTLTIAQPPATDTPTMPPIALLILAMLLIAAGSSFLPKPAMKNGCSLS